MKALLTQYIAGEDPEKQIREFPSRRACADWVAGQMIASGEQLEIQAEPYKAEFYFDGPGGARRLTFTVEEIA